MGSSPRRRAGRSGDSSKQRKARDATSLSALTAACWAAMRRAGGTSAAAAPRRDRQVATISEIVFTDSLKKYLNLQIRDVELTD